MNADILLRGAIPGPLAATLRLRFPGCQAAPAPDAIIDPGAVRAIVTMGSVRFDGPVMDRFARLGLIVCIGTGYDGIDVAAADARQISICNTPSLNAGAVADLAVALLLASVRRICPSDKWVRDGAWDRFWSPEFPIPRGLEGRRIGIFGFGDIGKRIAKRLGGFDVEIGYCGRRRDPASPLPYFENPLDLAEWASVLVVAIRGEPGNAKIVNRAILDRLGPGGHLINVSRGSTVDEDELVAALRAGRIAGAGLDVFAKEPGASPALHELTNTVLSPHVGGATQEALERAARSIAENIDAFRENRVPRHLVRIADA